MLWTLREIALLDSDISTERIRFPKQEWRVVLKENLISELISFAPFYFCRRTYFDLSMRKK